MKLKANLNEFWNSACKVLFIPNATLDALIFFRIWVVFLYLLGGVLWGMYLNWGRIDFSIFDWFEITGPRLYFLQDAILKGVLPLHIPYTSALILLTDRYLSIPDILISPQVFLLRFFQPAAFVLIQWLLMYSLGFWGILRFSRRYALSPFTFTLVFLLFNFSGNTAAHLSIGHFTWSGYFLLPWFVLCVLDFPQSSKLWCWVGKTAFLLLVVFLQGSFHQFVWMLIFLGFMIPLYPRRFWAPLAAGCFACLLSAVRIFPAAIISGTIHHDFMGGFPQILDLFSSLVVLRRPSDGLSANSVSFYAWQVDYYIGITGLVFLVVFGIYYWWKRRVFPQRFCVPILGLILLSISNNYQILNFQPIPLFHGERVTTRLFILPLVFLIFFAGVSFQHWLNRRNPSSILFTILVVGLNCLCFELWQHFQLWMLPSISASLSTDHFVFKPFKWVNANYIDSLYTGWMRRGAFVSLLTALMLIFLCWKEKIPQNKYFYGDY